MTSPVDLTNLRSMTDGDKEMEQALFEEFFTSFEAGLDVLKANCADSAAETWRKQAHALKGIALNLGAAQLGELCKKAQESHTTPEQEKTVLLGNIHAEYERVKGFLAKLTTA